MLFERGDLAAVRHFTTEQVVATNVATERRDDIVLAVSEAATNAIEHGGGRGPVRFWIDEAYLVIEVNSPSGVDVDPTAGLRMPDPGAARGRGLWRIRQLTDGLEIHLRHPGATLLMRSAI